jgi:hypothetical protein
MSLCGRETDIICGLIIVLFATSPKRIYIQSIFRIYISKINQQKGLYQCCRSNSSLLQYIDLRSIFGCCIFHITIFKWQKKHKPISVRFACSNYNTTSTTKLTQKKGHQLDIRLPPLEWKKSSCADISKRISLFRQKQCHH